MLDDVQLKRLGIFAQQFLGALLLFPRVVVVHLSCTMPTCINNNTTNNALVLKLLQRCAKQITLRQLTCLSRRGLTYVTSNFAVLGP